MDSMLEEEKKKEKGIVIGKFVPVFHTKYHTSVVDAQ